jgi:hypothetical protein
MSEVVQSMTFSPLVTRIVCIAYKLGSLNPREKLNAGDFSYFQLADELTPQSQVLGGSSPYVPDEIVEYGKCIEI